MNKQPEQIFKTPNKAGRPKGSKNKRTVIREALQETFADGEKGFWLAVATQAASGLIIFGHVRHTRRGVC